MSSGGQVLGGVLGAVAGFFLAGPGGALKGALYGAQIGMTIGGYLDPPKGPNTQGPRLDDLTVQTSTYGAVIPRVYGTVALTGNLFWLENNALKEVATTTENEGGKGGGGSSGSTTSFSYYGTFAVGLCAGPIAGVRRIWIGSKLVYDAGSTTLEGLLASGDAATCFTLYNGSDTQSPDPRMQAALGVANTPAHRGLAYLVFRDYPLADHGNSLMGAQVKVEVVGAATYAGAGIRSTMAAPNYYKGTAVLKYSGGSIVGSSIEQAATSKVYKSISSPFGVDRITRASVLSSDMRYPIDIPGNNRLIASYLAPGTNDIAFCETDTGYETGVRIPSRGYITFPSPSTCCWDDSSSRVVTIASLGAGPYQWGMSAGTDDGEWRNIVDLTTLPVRFYHIWNGGDGRLYADNAAGSLYQIDYKFNTIDGPWVYAAGYYEFLGRYGNYFYFKSGAAIYEYEFVNGNYTLVLRGSITLPIGWGYACYISSRSWWIRAYANVYVVSFTNYLISASVSLATVVQNEALASNLLAPADLDTSALTDAVRGYRISAVSSIRSAIEPLQGAFTFDVVQSGYTIDFRRRGVGGSVGTIPAEDLDARGAGDAPGVSITNSREMDSVLPRRVAITYLDIAREYDTGEQYAERLNTDAVNVLQMQMPLVMTATEAAATAERLLYLYWMERYDVALRLPPPYSMLEPGDVVTVQASEGTYSLRLTSITYEQDGRLEVNAKYANPAIYVAAAIGEEGGVSSESLTMVGSSLVELLDIPLLLSTADTPGFPVGMTGNLTGWAGGVLYRSDDGGQTWAQLRGFAAPGAVMGFSIAAIGAGRTDLIDKASVLTVTLHQGELFSVTESAMLNGANHFCYGTDGRWEIIAAQNCVEQPDGSYVLTDLLRGRAGTEWARSLHLPNDRLVLLDSQRLSFIAANLNTIGAARTYRAVTVGKTLDTASDVAFTYAGVNLECLSPVYLNGSRHPSTNDWTLTWLRRTRIGGEWRDYVDATLGEASEAYEIDVFSDSSYATLKRTLTGLTSASAAYTSAQQVTDFGSNQATLYVKIYQLSATVGRGYPLTQSITR